MKKCNTHKIDLLLRYTLLVAGQEDWGSRELGMIYLIKYLYLADLAYSEHHNGETYTGLNWKFYHFGPWAEELYQRIEPALLATGAEKKVYPSTKYEKDCVRWSMQNDELYDELDSKLSIILSGAIQNSVHKFGLDTEGLLHFGYQLKAGHSVISINYVGCILCTMVVHRMHPTWICYVNFGQLMFYDNQEQKVRKCSALSW